MAGPCPWEASRQCSVLNVCSASCLCFATLNLTGLRSKLSTLGSVSLVSGVALFFTRQVVYLICSVLGVSVKSCLTSFNAPKKGNFAYYSFSGHCCWLCLDHVHPTHGRSSFSQCLTQHNKLSQKLASVSC